MKKPILDLQALKTFVLGMELKSFALAAKYQHKSTSAVSAHLKKLEAQTNSILVVKDGRNLLPTEQGLHLLSYAKKMLALNDEVLETLTSIDLQGSLALGLQEDFSDAVLTECLGRFTRINEKIHLNTRIDRYLNLITSMQDNSLDLSMTWEGSDRIPNAQVIAKTKIQWIISPEFPIQHFIENDLPLPLVMVEPNCLFKQKAIEALEKQGIRWKMVYQSQSLGGIWPAVSAGLGITARTCIGKPDALTIVKSPLPNIGNIGIQVHRSQEANNPMRDKLIDLITETIKNNYIER